MRATWVFLGLLFFALGLVGVVLPLVPTAPFMLLAAFCFARSSERLHDWLLSHRHFGPPIMDWREHGAITLRAKRISTVSIAAVLILSLALGLSVAVLLVQAGVLSLVLLFIWTRPNH